jgi:hypothetical protein
MKQWNALTKKFLAKLGLKKTALLTEPFAKQGVGF